MIINKLSRKIICNSVVKRKTLFEKATGLMFKKNLSEDTCYAFYFDKKQQISIHMMFVYFSIDVLFLDENNKVVEITRLNPWKFYKSKQKSKLFLEFKAGVLRKKKVKVGDFLEIY